MAVNMYESWASNLVSANILSSFLHDCARTHEASPGTDTLTIVEDVSCGYGAASKSYLRQCRQGQFPSVDMERLSNTMNTVNFHSFLLDDKYKSGGGGLPVVLPKIPVHSPSGLRDYQARLSQVTADPVWKNPGATIGRPLPHPSNCWITTDQFGEDPNAPTYPDDAATEARDKLGLIDTASGSFLLRLSFLASSTTKVPDNEFVRPTFSDLGNSRFRVSQSSSRATMFAKQGWGATVHLGMLGYINHNESTGASERVSSALPLDILESLTVELLGRVANDRGTGVHDNDDAYAKELEAGQTTTAIKNNLLSILI